MFKLTSILGDFRRTTTGEYNYCCPLCVRRVGSPDKKYHLYVNPTRYLYGIRGWYYCHRCKSKGPLHRLTKEESVTARSVTEWSKFIKRIRGEFKESDKPKIDVTLPKDYVEIIKETQAYEYLRNRSISDEQIAFYNIGFGTQDIRQLEPEDVPYYAGSGRIIFPDYDDDGTCVYWVARTYKGHKVKYKNPAQSNARDKIFNLVKASRYPTCVIAEGVISAIACGYNGVATYGKEVTQQQIDMLVSVGFDHYCVAHDGDARKESLVLADKLERRGCSVSLVYFRRNEDPASVSDIGDRIHKSIPCSFRNKILFKLGY